MKSAHERVPGGGDEKRGVPVSENHHLPYAELLMSEGDPNPTLRRAIEEVGLPAMEAFEKMVDLFVRAYKEGKPAVIQGATGSGKSMLVPLAAKMACRRLGITERIAMSQPRKDATQAVANGVSALRREEVGGAVGWMTAEHKRVGQYTDTVVMTDGIFKRHLLEGEMTRSTTGALIVDEVHEQGINTEIALAKIRQMQENGTAPLVIFVSATLNKEEIQKHFDLTDEQYLKVEGRTYPIETHHNLEDLPGRKSERDYSYLDVVQRAILECVGRDKGDTEEGGTNKAHSSSIQKDTKLSWVSPEPEGDILVFLPGVREIEDVQTRVESCLYGSSASDSFEVCVYHGSLQPSVREEAVRRLQGKSTKRRVILATNAAETSITFRHVRTVIDTGVRRIQRYDPKNRHKCQRNSQCVAGRSKPARRTCRKGCEGLMHSSVFRKTIYTDA